MFQLNSYHANEQLKWMGINIGSVIIRHIFTIASIVTLLICNDVKASTLFIAAGFICFNGAFVKAKKAKKQKMQKKKQNLREKKKSACFFQNDTV